MQQVLQNGDKKVDFILQDKFLQIKNNKKDLTFLTKKIYIL